MMKTFLFLDSLTHTLSPLSDNTCIAMLPVAGKPLVAYTVEELARAGLDDVVIVASAGARQVAEFLASGERWGMRFEYFPSRGQEHPAAILRRYGCAQSTPFLVLKGDMLLAGIGGFVERASQAKGAVIGARVSDQAAGLYLCRGDFTDLEKLPWPGNVGPGCSAPDHWLEMDAAGYCPMSNLAEFHRASLQMAAGGFKDYKLAGWERQPGLIIGPGSSIDDKGIATDHCYVGKGCHIHSKANLQASVVVNDNCFIDRGALVENSVILPGTYIGSNLNVSNALVNGRQIIRVDTGASYTITDPFILSSMASGLLQSWLPALGNRLLGLVLLALSLPLWPIAALLLLLQSSKPYAQCRRYYSNRLEFDPDKGWAPRVFSAWQLRLKSPVLRSLPMLFSVIQGHINIFGARMRPLQQDTLPRQPWDDVGCTISAGLLGPVQLYLPADAPVEEQLLSEIDFDYHRSLGGDLAYLLRATASLFTFRAWGSTSRCEVAAAPDSELGQLHASRTK